jgi:RNA polymerase sigma factor (sigma-70 family)
VLTILRRFLKLYKKVKISLSEAELVQAIRARQRVGSEALYDMYSASLFGVIVRIVQKQELAEDLLQDTFLKIWNSFDSYDEKKGRLFTWMVNLARNLSIDKLRSKDFRNNTRNRDIENSVISIDEQRSIALNPEVLGMKEMVNKLRPEAKAVLDLIYFRGYTQAEAAEELGIPLGTVKTRVRLAILSLRKLFN